MAATPGGELHSTESLLQRLFPRIAVQSRRHGEGALRLLCILERTSGCPARDLPAVLLQHSLMLLQLSRALTC